MRIFLRNSLELKELRASAVRLAIDRRRDYLGVEHYFLCLRELPPSHPVQQILSRTLTDLEGFWQELEELAWPELNRPASTDPPETPRLKLVLKLARQFARYERAPEVGVVHFLFAVAHEAQSLPATVLAKRHQAQMPEYGGHDALAAQFTGYLRLNPRGFLAFRRRP